MKQKQPLIEDQPPHVQAVLQNAEELVKRGVEVHFKFTCAKCGARCTFEEKNAFYEKGDCEDCHHVTDLQDPKAELNFLAVASGDSASEYLAYVLGLLGKEKQ